MSIQSSGKVEVFEREARLLPVVSCICLMAVGILAGSYLIGNYLL